jgi:hypothetical protein
MIRTNLARGRMAKRRLELVKPIAVDGGGAALVEAVDEFAPVVPPAVQIRKLWVSESLSSDPVRREKTRAELAKLGE